MVSGNGQLVGEQFLSNAQFVVQAKDSAGHPVPNVAVTWTTSSGLSSVNGDDKTDANGLASATFHATFLQALASFLTETVTASSAFGNVDFVVTTISAHNGPTAGASYEYIAPTLGDTLTGASGTTLPGAVQVRVFASFGFLNNAPIPNVGLRVANLEDAADPAAPSPVHCNGPNGLVLTDENGMATCDLVITGAPGTPLLTGVIGEQVKNPFFHLNITQGANCTYSLSAPSQSFGSAAGTGSVNVVTSSGCGWTATSNAGFITITAGATGTGSGTVNYTVSTNTGAARSGILTIAGKTYTVSQGAAAPGGLAITTQSLPIGTVSVPYSATLAATGGQPPYTWSIAGTLPSGVALNATSGSSVQLTGTPSASSAGTYPISVTVKDNANATQSRQFTITINGVSQSGFNITNAAFPNGVVSQAYKQLLTSSGGCVSPFAPRPIFSLASGKLPGGLSIQPNSDGTQSIAGTPTSIGSSDFTLSAKDACAAVTTRSFTILVTNAPGSSQMLLNTILLAFSVQLGSAAAPADQNITVNSDSGVLNYSTSVSTNTGANWLVVKTGASGATPGQIAVGVTNYSGLAPGTYNGSITVSSQAANSPVVVNVSLTVLNAPAVTLVSPAAFTIDAFQSSAPNITTKSIVLASGGTPVHFTAQASTTSGAPWLTLSATQGDTPATLTATVDSGGLAVGTDTGKVVIAPLSGAPLTVNFTLNVAQPVPALTAVVNAASFLSGPLAAGEIVTLFGTNVGPPTLANYHITEFGRLDTTLADTIVYFDGFPAPLIYASADKVSAIVPYEVAGNSTTDVFVQYLGLRSNTVTIPLADSAPGIFMLDTAGQGAILNEDGNVNGVDNGAEPGSIVAIFATGEGQTEPAGVDGSIADSVLRKPRLKVSVEIDGQPAELKYAGAAPLAPAGLLQVNAVVPLSVPRGKPVSVVIKIGDAFSQDGVMLAIKP